MTRGQGIARGHSSQTLFLDDMVTRYLFKTEKLWSRPSVHRSLYIPSHFIVKGKQFCWKNWYCKCIFIHNLLIFANYIFSMVTNYKLHFQFRDFGGSSLSQNWQCHEIVCSTCERYGRYRCSLKAVLHATNMKSYHTTRRTGEEILNHRVNEERYTLNVKINTQTVNVTQFIRQTLQWTVYCGLYCICVSSATTYFLCIGPPDWGHGNLFTSTAFCAFLIVAALAKISTLQIEIHL